MRGEEHSQQWTCLQDSCQNTGVSYTITDPVKEMGDSNEPL